MILLFYDNYKINKYITTWKIIKIHNGQYWIQNTATFTARNSTIYNYHRKLYYLLFFFYNCCCSKKHNTNCNLHLCNTLNDGYSGPSLCLKNVGLLFLSISISIWSWLKGNNTNMSSWFNYIITKHYENYATHLNLCVRLILLFYSFTPTWLYYDVPQALPHY